MGVTNVILGTDQAVTSLHNIYTDFSALGVVLYQMLCPKGNLRERLKKVRKLDPNKTNFKLKNKRQVPEEVRLFLMQSLNKELSWTKIANHKLFSIQMQTYSSLEFTRRENEDIGTLINISPQQQHEIMELTAKISDGLIEFYDHEEPVFKHYSNCSSIVLCNTEQANEQTKKYQHFLRLHLKRNIWEFIHVEIIGQIERIKPFNLGKTSNIQLLYMLSCRCFLQMTSLKQQYELLLKAYPDDKEIKYLTQKQINLCEKYSKLFQSSHKRLRDAEDKFKNIFKDFFKNILFYTEMRKKNELMYDVESLQDRKKRNEHINWIQNELNKVIQIPKTQEVWALYRKFKIFAKLAHLTFEDVKNKDFQEVVKELIHQAQA